MVKVKETFFCSYAQLFDHKTCKRTYMANQAISTGCVGFANRSTKFQEKASGFWIYICPPPISLMYIKSFILGFTCICTHQRNQNRTHKFYLLASSVTGCNYKPVTL